jgi:MFS family permease
MKNVFYGWIVVAAAFTVACFGWGLGFYGPSVYLETVVARTGWSVALVSAAVTFHFVLGAAAIAALPRLHRRIGVARTTLTGSVLLALGVYGWAIAAAPWELFVAAGLSGVGWVALGAVGVNAIVSPWFDKRRPAALAMAYNGASIGGTIFTPLWVALIAGIGFAVAALWIGAAMVATIAILAVTVLGRTPGAMGLAPDGGPIQAANGASTSGPALAASLRRDPAFVTLAAGMALGLFAQIGLIAHLFSLLVPALGAQGAGFAAGFATACAIFGRTALGWLLPDGADRRNFAVLNYAVQIAGCVAFLIAGGADVPWLIAGVVLVGLGIGNTTSLPPLIAQREFAKPDVPKAVAAAVAIGQGTYAFAPFAFGLVRETGFESGVFVLAIAVFALAGAAYLAGRGAYRLR